MWMYVRRCARAPARTDPRVCVRLVRVFSIQHAHGVHMCTRLHRTTLLLCCRSAPGQFAGQQLSCSELSWVDVLTLPANFCMLEDESWDSCVFCFAVIKCFAFRSMAKCKVVGARFRWRSIWKESFLSEEQHLGRGRFPNPAVLGFF